MIWTTYRLPILAVLIVGFVFILFSFIRWETEHSNHEIISYGNVDIRQVDLGFRVSGRLKELRFEEGDAVKAGDVMAVLDQVPYQNELDSAAAQVKQAEADFAKKKRGNRPEEIQQAESTVEERQATFHNAINVLKRQTKLLKSGTASRQTYDNAIQQKEEAEARLHNAKENLELMRQGFRVEDIQAAEAALALAKANFAIAETNFKDTVLIAPSDGVIFSRIREIGAIVGVGSTVYSLSLHHPIWVRSYVSEPDLGRIKPGGKALIYTDSQEEPFGGKIGFISPQAEFTPKNVETKELRPDLMYRLRIQVEDPKGQLRHGMPVTVHLILDEEGERNKKPVATEPAITNPVPHTSFSPQKKS